MLFSSPIFFAFFSLYFSLHLFVNNSLRLYLILFGSAFFFAYWNPLYLWLPLALTVLSYYGRIWMKAGAPSFGKRRLGFVIALLLIPLLFYKYTNFLFGQKIIDLKLPLGISFITFTLIAYIVDVYRGKFPVERSFTKLLGTVLFFPHLIAGPIVRPSQLIPAIARHVNLSLIPYRFGIALFTWGLFKKLVLADPIAGVVDKIYSTPGPLGWTEACFVLYGFTLQIYCDFSGYTDMALGLARLLGIKLPHNFNRPYVATSIVDFWKRWHITLSTWLRDYLYIPLGGNRQGKLAQSRNLFITMGLGGLWHGANITFLVWGLFHALGITINHFFSGLKLPKIVGWVLTLHFVAVGWIFFRSPGFQDALRIFQGFTHTANPAFLAESAFALAILAVFPLLHVVDSHSRVRLAVRKLPRVFFYPLLVFFWIVAIAISSGNSAQFIYFEF